ncbi:BadF/BadG/BcrA/BcrD ATPase family protein [Streptomyces sp. NPDC051940]|uniref:N-acetylglucosamine kinase n=1 Tax=Streptomyces sp. NPDC051940 TaxID=3155675 RepID=UPI00342EC56C
MGVTQGASAPAAAVLAVDAGNSKTDVALVSADGEVLGAGRSGGFQPPVVGVEPAVDVLAEAVRQAAASAGIPAGSGPLARHVSACLANADFPAEEEALTAAIARRGWAPGVEVRNDTFAVLRAGVEQPRGVAVVCGAGINCVGMLPDGRTTRFPAIGRISGDWGGGGGLADEALWYAARAADGRGEPTELSRAVPEHFRLRTMGELIEALHFDRVPVSRRHEIAPVLFAVAAAGDPVARSLVDRQADEVVAMASVALEKLDLLSEPADVVLGGSVLAARHPQLDAGIRARLAARAPKAVTHVVTAPPVLGAVLLGMDAVGAPPSAQRRVRAQYA